MLQQFTAQRRAFEDNIMKTHLQALKQDPEPGRDADVPVPSFEEVETRFENLEEHFTHNPVVNRLTHDQQKSLCRTMWKRHVVAGQVVIPEGGMGDMCYIIIKGKYEVFKKGKTEALCAYAEPGQSFGELALLYRRPRAATVKAVTDGELWVIDRKSFSKVMFEQKRRISVAVPKIQDKETLVLRVSRALPTHPSSPSSPFSPSSPPPRSLLAPSSLPPPPPPPPRPLLTPSSPPPRPLLSPPLRRRSRGISLLKTCRRIESAASLIR
jgi:CRP-like cAMP-binding protein